MSDKKRVLMSEEEAEKVLGGVLCYDCQRGRSVYYVWSDEDSSKRYGFSPSSRIAIGDTIFYECDGMTDEQILSHLEGKGLIWLA